MAWTDGADKSTGDVITAAIWNGYLGTAGSIQKTAPAVVTTAGDIVYATGDNAIARLAIGGTEGHVLSVSSGSVPEWASAAGGSWTYEGGNTTEYTTTSTSNADLVTISSLNIAAAKQLVICTRWHSTADASAFRAGGVLQLNGADYSTSLKDVGYDSASSISESFLIQWINPREASYSDGGMNLAGGSYGTGGGLFDNQFGLPYNAGGTAWDTEAITSVKIGGRVGNASITLKLKGVYIYSIATS